MIDKHKQKMQLLLVITSLQSVSLRFPLLWVNKGKHSKNKFTIGQSVESILFDSRDSLRESIIHAYHTCMQVWTQTHNCACSNIPFH